MEIFSQIEFWLLHYIITQTYVAFLELLLLIANCVLLLSSSRLMASAIRNEKARRYLGQNGPTALLSYQQLYHAAYKLLLVPLLFVVWWIGIHSGIVHIAGSMAVIAIAVSAAILSVSDEITSARLKALLRPSNPSLRDRLDDISRRNQHVT